MTDTKYIELGKKLQALVRRGKGGEAINAKRQLDRLMAKYGITPEELEDEIYQEVEFKVKGKDRKLFMHVAISVTGINRPWKFLKKNKTRFYGEVTKVEEVEIRAKFDFYLRFYKEEADVFLSAFIHANHLYAKDMPPSDGSDLTAAEIMRARRMLDLAEGIEPKEFIRQIGKGK